MSYTPDYVLKMPARRFFSMNKSRLLLQEKERNLKYLELCHVQAVGGVGSMEYYENLSTHYRDMTLSEKDRSILEKRRNRIFDADDPNSNKYAANVLNGFFNLAGFNG